jgi:hypothetical protein
MGSGWGVEAFYLRDSYIFSDSPWCSIGWMNQPAKTAEPPDLAGEPGFFWKRVKYN